MKLKKFKTHRKCFFLKKYTACNDFFKTSKENMQPHVPYKTKICWNLSRISFSDINESKTSESEKSETKAKLKMV